MGILKFLYFFRSSSFAPSFPHTYHSVRQEIPIHKGLPNEGIAWFGNHTCPKGHKARCGAMSCRNYSQQNHRIAPTCLHSHKWTDRHSPYRTPSILRLNLPKASVSWSRTMPCGTLRSVSLALCFCSDRTLPVWCAYTLPASGLIRLCIEVKIFLCLFPCRIKFQYHFIISLLSMDMRTDFNLDLTFLLFYLKTGQSSPATLISASHRSSSTTLRRVWTASMWAQTVCHTDLQSPILVHIYLDDADSVTQHFLHLLKDGVHHLAWLAPGGEEIDQDKLVTWYNVFECFHYDFL